jgi:hypothetical protein
MVCGRRLDGRLPARWLEKTVQLNPGSWANADGTAVITQDPQKAPNGSGFVHIIDGTLAGYYLVPTAGTVEPPPEPPPAGDYSEGYADGAANTQLAWQGWLEARPVGELEAWAGTAPQTPPPVGRRGLRDRISEDEPQAVALE